MAEEISGPARRYLAQGKTQGTEHGENSHVGALEFTGGFEVQEVCYLYVKVITTT
jgi:hypothetical protein